MNSTKDVKKGYSEFLIFNTDAFFVDGMTSEKLRKLLDETSLNTWAWPYSALVREILKKDINWLKA
ncbi:hypothetical protein [Nitrososphaera sp. AFS]|uniref:hypothetical protein n=1 Tax=Nitrososphaera sp. AFS TaxID=2301191 RepID=UPI00139239CD|nr:hypothetical protein [Nitrososphaera sp. AFS]NAL78871.1 hypothetical protein [Nitrososphaera sp. AFS]